MLCDCVLAVFLAVALSALPHASQAQTFDLQTSRIPITEVDSAWRFHLGDDPSWAQKDFDDSRWQTLDPLKNWSNQGYPVKTELAWFRFRLLAPAHTRVLVLEMSKVAKNYQLFCDGQMIAQVGPLPPGPAHNVEGAARLFTLPVHAGDAATEVSIALRLWQDPAFAGTRRHSLFDRVFAGAPDAVLEHFSNAKAAQLVSEGDNYLQVLISIIVGAATLLLFGFTRERFYLWFAVYIALANFTLVINAVAAHQAWDFAFFTYFKIAVGLLAQWALVLFIVEALSLPRGRSFLVPGAAGLIAYGATVLAIHRNLSLKSADITFCLAMSLVFLLLDFYLLRGWRRGNLYAKLLFLPFTVTTVFVILNNLGYALNDLHLAPSFNMQPLNIILFEQPFGFSLEDAGQVFSLLGLLAVLVYRFARTNREQQRLTAALKAAHDIQQRLVPVDVPALGGLRTEIAYRAAEEVGGDFCQILPRPDGSIFIAIGDVSGKGLQAAMLGAVAVGALRSMADEAIDPGQALERLNNVLLRTENSGFITCLCMVLTEDGEVLVANAGHLSPYLNGTEMALDAGLPLGILSGLIYEQRALLLPATARLTLLSDGVVEARSRTGELFGFDRTTSVSELTASEIADTAHNFGQEDDITVITLDWKVAELAMA
jgi:sigma-B regulation protein RsbU (phosphoserine phosphatase)